MRLTHSQIARVHLHGLGYIGRAPASWKACTPTLKRVRPRAMYSRRRAASKVPGSASMEISAPGMVEQDGSCLGTGHAAGARGAVFPEYCLQQGIAWVGLQDTKL